MDHSSDYMKDYLSSNDVSFDNRSMFCENSVHEHYLSENTKILKVDELAHLHNVNNDRLVRRIDIHLLPVCFVIMTVSFMNKTSFGTLLINGLLESFNLDIPKFTGVFTAFYGPYVVLQAVSNILLKNVRPHFWMGLSILFYGAACLGAAFSKSFAVLVVCELLHGVFQSCTETAIYYILAHYYTHHEAQIRFSGIYCGSTVGFIVNTLLAYCCEEKLDQVHGLQSWRWLLLIESSITMASSVLIFFTLPDFPEGARYLSTNEALFLVKKLEMFSGSSGYDFAYTWRECLATVCDPLVFVPALINFAYSFLTMGVINISPMMVRLLGYHKLESVKILVYPFVIALCWTLSCALVSKKLKLRFPLVLLNLLMVEIGGGLVAVNFNFDSPHDPYKVTALFLFIICGFAGMPILLCWVATNLGGHLRKSLGIALNISVGSLGALSAFYVFMGKDSVRNKSGIITGIVFVSLAIVLVFVYVALLHRENKKKRLSEYKSRFEAFSEREKICIGDKSPSLDYVY